MESYASQSSAASRGGVDRELAGKIAIMFLNYSFDWRLNLTPYTKSIGIE